MSKRFTDTNKFKNPWRRKMPLAYRELWEFMLCECDHAGIWRVDLELAAFTIGAEIDPSQVEIHFKDKIVKLDHDKWFIPSFIEFQYGELLEASKPHNSVIKILHKHGIDPKTLTLKSNSLYPLVTPTRGIDTTKDKEKDKDKAKAFEGGVGETLAEEITSEAVDVAWGVWCDSLTFHKIPPTHISPTQQVSLYQAMRAHGVQNVLDALEGFRYEKADKGYNPKNHASLDFIFKINPKTNKSNWERLGNVARSEREAAKIIAESDDPDYIAEHGRHLDA